MLKVIIIIALLVGAFWYFQPEKFDNTVDMIKDKAGFDSKNETVKESTISNIVNDATIQDITAQDEGYCIIDESCVYVAESQCPEILFNSKTLCQESLGITPVNESLNNPLHNYVGFPLDLYGSEYDCSTDSDCNFDNTNCKDTHCQCDYATGECYID